MKYEELLAKMDNLDIALANGFGDAKAIIGCIKATRAVIELHKPIQDEWFDIDEIICEECTREEYTRKYPCSTIQAIQKELK